MKRFGWMLALPWVIHTTTGTRPYEVIRDDRKANYNYTCTDEKKWQCDDMVFALNEAHERRTTWSVNQIDMTACCEAKGCDKCKP